MIEKERPCTRCIKRNIGHLCHDEPRETSKRSRNSEYDHSVGDDEGSTSNEFSNVQGMPRNVDVQDAAGQQLLADGSIGLPPPSVNQMPPSSSSGQGINPNSQQGKVPLVVWTREWGPTDIFGQLSDTTSGWVDRASSKTCTPSILHTCSTHTR